MSSFTDNLKGLGSSIKKTATDTAKKAEEFAEEYDLEGKAKKAGEATKKAAKEVGEGISTTTSKIKDNHDRKKQMHFKSVDDLKKVTAIINETANAIASPKKIMDNSPLAVIVSAAIGRGIVGNETFLEIYEIGESQLESTEDPNELVKKAAVAGGVVAGVVILSAPILALAGAGALGITALKSKKLLEEKQRLLDEANMKHKALLQTIEREADAPVARTGYLKGLNVLLEHAIMDLQDDIALGKVI